ncbi:hypothetical protein E3A20_09490 [Planctomyces bekefii]|uniref:Galactose oxidase n=1 Tax=Planctomyces bekefii TaxID=1653850 RepID=A0A5C6M7E8_9PLAN|nr:hypothetical protein E3A20_09490 [Planctomyces bekefii]
MKKKQPRSQPALIGAPFVVAIFALSLLNWTLPAEAGRRVGNGDQLRLLFASAKEHAAQVVLRIHDRAFAAHVKPEVRSWIMANKAALAGDVAASEHQWSLDAATTCAATDIPTASDGNLPKASAIRFSYPACSNRDYSLSDAGSLLVHESMHHFGIDDEMFADEVALAIYQAWEQGNLEWIKVADGTPRSYGTSVWTGSRLIVVGGMDVAGRTISAPEAYDPKSDTWSSLSAAQAPSRYNMQGVWTGQALIVWGGYVVRGTDSVWQNSGAIWTEADQQWRPLATPFGPSELTDQIGNIERGAQTLIWTGKEVIVFGGSQAAYGRNPGGIFNPATGRWREVATLQAPDKVGGHTAVWADDRMLVWGGIDSARNKTSTGASYNPETNVWAEMASAEAPQKRDGHQALWTGAEMIVFGGDVNSVEANGTGGLFDPVTNRWKTVSSESVPARTGHTLVWTGSEMLVVGGKPKLNTKRLMFQNVNAFDPVRMTWRIVDAKNAPQGRAFHTSVWTGSSMIVIGGYDSASQELASGGVFYP